MFEGDAGRTSLRDGPERSFCLWSGRKRLFIPEAEMSAPSAYRMCFVTVSASGKYMSVGDFVGPRWSVAPEAQVLRRDLQSLARVEVFLLGNDSHPAWAIRSLWKASVATVVSKRAFSQ
jgi:hypothetical protein